MAGRISAARPATEQTCFTWIGALPCFSATRRVQNVDKEAKEATTSSVQREHGSVLWSAGPMSAEMLRVVFPELPTARAFFKCFIADNASYTILEGDFAPWNEHIITSDGVLENWTLGKTRKMQFLAYPVPPGWVPFKKYILTIEHLQRYQFVVEQSTGLEMLQFETNIHVNQETGRIPYADSFTMRQLWTVRATPSEDGRNTVCKLHVTAEANFGARPPLLAPIIRNRAFAEHRGGTAGWLKGARACLDRLATMDGSTGGSLLINVDTEDSGAGALASRMEHSKEHNHALRNACPWAWMMACFCCVMWVTFMTVEVVPMPIKMNLFADPIYPSLLLSLRGLLAL